MSELKNICVYCGSAEGVDPVFMNVAEELGTAMAKAGVGLVYGGGNHGLMGAVARAAIAHGGRVTGIIPDFLRQKENMLTSVQDLHIVPDMHTRKQMMFEKADAFVALPGGIGTLEELVEQLTWVQLQRHRKPVLLADISGFWQPLLSLLGHMREQGFIRPSAEVVTLVTPKVEAIIPMLRAAVAASAAPDKTLLPGL